MPALPFVNNTLKITLGWTFSGKVGPETILHWQYSGGPPTAADCTTIAAGVSSAFSTALKSLLSSSHQLSSVTVLDLASATGKQGLSATSVAGTRTGGSLYINQCVNLQFTIARRYRGGKPKAFLPFGTVTDATGVETWATSFPGTVAGDWATFTSSVDAITSGSTTMVGQVSVSYYQGYNAPTTLPSGRVKQTPKLRTTPVVDPVVSAICNPKYGQQRRRLHF